MVAIPWSGRFSRGSPGRTLLPPQPVEPRFHRLEGLRELGKRTGAGWYRKYSEISEDHLVEQTVNYGLSAILKR